jgi:hypothetical protein
MERFLAAMMSSEMLPDKRPNNATVKLKLLLPKLKNVDLRETSVSAQELSTTELKRLEDNRQ